MSSAGGTCQNQFGFKAVSLLLHLAFLKGWSGRSLFLKVSLIF